MASILADDIATYGECKLDRELYTQTPSAIQAEIDEIASEHTDMLLELLAMEDEVDEGNIMVLDELEYD